MKNLIIPVLLLCSAYTLRAQEFMESLPDVTHQIAADGPFNYKSLLDTLNYKLVRNDGDIVPNTPRLITFAVDNTAYGFNNVGRNVTIFKIDSVNGLHRIKSGFSQLFMFPSGYGRTLAADKSDRLGIIDRNGDFVTYLDSAITTVRTFSDGYAVVSVNDLHGYIDTLGNVAIAPKFTDAYKFNCGHAVVRKPHNGDYVIIDKKGREKGRVSMLDYEAPMPKTPTFYCGLLPMWSKNITAMLDFEGKEVWNMQGRWHLDSALDSCMLMSNDGIYRVVDAKGNILKENAAPIWFLGSQRLGVKEGKIIYLCNLQGERIAPVPFNFIRPFYDGHTAFATTTDGRWIIIDVNGQELKEVPELRGWNMHPRIPMLPPFEDYITKDPKRL